MASHPADDKNVRTSVATGVSAPRWDRGRGIYPTSLRRYLECPYRCRLEYIDRIPYDQPWTRPIEVGNALHKVMERVAHTLQKQQSPPSIPSLRGWVGDMLPAQEYDDPDARIEDIDNVLTWAATGMHYINANDITMLRIEKHYPRDWHDPGELGHVRLGAKADAVMLRHDDDGPYVEIIDYKSGWSRKWSRFTPILSRIALKKRIQAALPRQRYPRVTFTYLWFAHEEFEHIELSRKRMEDDWRELESILTRMMQEETWPKRPDARVCQHCPYCNTVCFPFPDQSPGTPS